MVTPKLRPIEIGILNVGAISAWPGILIPPAQESFKLTYYCKNNCLNVKNNLFW
jgi:hypothetical protein